MDMARLHITQDETGFWQLSLEDDAGQLTLISHQFQTPDHLIEDARELVADGVVPGGVILVGPPRAPRDRSLEVAPGDYKRPAPRKAIE
jgi:hypothetical protein